MAVSSFTRKRAASARKHGHALADMQTREYRIWSGMRQRCSNPKATAYALYGGRGIKVAPAWDSYAQFLQDMGPCPSAKHSLDRIDANGDYAPGNCRWATHAEQMVNTSRNKWVEWRGERMPISHAIRKSGVSPQTVYRRLAAGWDIQAALETPAYTKRAA